MYAANEKPLCGHKKPIAARRLCINCYNRHYYGGTLHHFPTGNHNLKDVVEDYLRMRGASNASIARAIGMTPKALDAALNRAVARGLLTSEQAGGKKGTQR